MYKIHILKVKKNTHPYVHYFYLWNTKEDG